MLYLGVNVKILIEVLIDQIIYYYAWVVIAGS